MSAARFAPTEYGFYYGAAEVERLIVRPDGSVVIGIKSKRDSIQVSITPTGLIRVFRKGKKLKEQPE